MYLRKDYKRQKSILHRYIKSGCSYEEAAKIIGKTLWVHFNALKFIDDHDNDRTTVSNVEESLSRSSTSSTGESVSASSPPLTPGNSGPCLNTPSRKGKRNISENTTALDELIMHEVEKGQMDSSDYFCKMLSLEMEKLNPHQNHRLSDGTVDEAATYFYEVLSDAFKLFVPRKRVFVLGFPYWFSKDTIKVIREKRKMHKKWKRYRNRLDYLTFSLLRGRSKFLIDRDYRNFIVSAESSIRHDPKRFWSFVRAKRATSDLPAEVAFDGVTATDGAHICDLFSRYFGSVFNASRTSSTSNGSRCGSPRFCDLSLQFEQVEILKALRAVNPSGGPGGDGIPPIIIKN
nr:uncharacterized protein LOC111421543 [Onthophagus taurus]